jgi:hypothetical protein
MSSSSRFGCHLRLVSCAAFSARCLFLLRVLLAQQVRPSREFWCSYFFSRRHQELSFPKRFSSIHCDSAAAGSVLCVPCLSAGRFFVCRLP